MTRLLTDNPAATALSDLVAEVGGTLDSLEALHLAVQALLRRPEGLGDLLLKLVRFGVVGVPAGETGDARVTLELTEHGRLLMSAVGALRRHLGAVEGLLVQHSPSSSVGLEAAVGTESPGPANAGPGEDGGAA